MIRYKCERCGVILESNTPGEEDTCPQCGKVCCVPTHDIRPLRRIMARWRGCLAGLNPDSRGHEQEIGATNAHLLREVIRAMLPALVGTGVLVLLWGLHYLAYGPRRGLYSAIGVSPILWYAEDAYCSLSIFSDLGQFTIWASACCFFVLGPLVAFLLSRCRTAYIFSVALLLGVVTHGCLGILRLAVDALDSVAPPVTVAKVASFAWIALLWIFALSLGGAAVGIVLQRIVRVVARRAARRKTTART